VLGVVTRASKYRRRRSCWNCCCWEEPREEENVSVCVGGGWATKNSRLDCDSTLH
jgi:hypothetical protein